MTDTKTLSAQQTQALLQEALAALAGARRRLGETVAVGDSSSSSEIRTEIADIELRITDLEAALARHPGT